MATKSLYQSLIEEFGLRSITSRQLPDAITQNLNPKLSLRPYQTTAIQLFDIYAEEYLSKPNSGSRQLLFHMATGSGKTLVMASAMLDLYRQGFRNFLFFVDSAAIINKTRDNFLNKSAAKHLFASNTAINGQHVLIQEVENFQSSNPDAINIVFTTIQGLHTQMTTPRENALTIDDFRAHSIVLISDEAHHINADTRQAGRANQVTHLESPSWENTVEQIFQANSSNVLLEFTATMDFENPGIQTKYLPRLLFDYPLKEFRKDGYSKDVTVLQSDTEIVQRAIAAVILSQWRRKIFSDHQLKIKPVILFKARTIKDGDSFYQEFLSALQTLDEGVLAHLKAKADGLLEEAFTYLESSGITLQNFALEIQEDFSEDKHLIVNSKSATEAKQIILNSLEDADNEYRAVFAVDMLNEGWDVLNLFDIVRLYDTRDAKNNKVGKTTMSEAQLIGRGARYFPFQTESGQERDKRKFDNDLTNPLRLCETLVYHSAYNPRYIQELNAALKEIGLVANESVAREMKIRESFRKSKTYLNGMLFLNQLVKKDYSQIHSLESYLTSQNFKHTMGTGFTLTSQVFEAEVSNQKRNHKTLELTLGDFNRHLLRKSLNRNPFFTFKNLRSYLPNLESVDDFISETKYLAGVKVTVDGPHASVAAFTPDEALFLIDEICGEIETRMKSQKAEYVGSTEFKPVALAQVLKDKTINIANDDAGNRELGRSMTTPGESALHLDLSTEEWFSHDDFFGTSEEKHLIRYFKTLVPKLKQHFSDVHLIRNERFFKIYNFSDGAATEPDFLAILKGKNDSHAISLQVFIEPKGDHLLAHDQWKENFLKEIKAKGSATLLTQNEYFLVWGMPFYNKSTEAMFAAAFDEVFTITASTRK